MWVRNVSIHNTVHHHGEKKNRSLSSIIPHETVADTVRTQCVSVCVEEDKREYNNSAKPHYTVSVRASVWTCGLAWSVPHSGVLFNEEPLRKYTCAHLLQMVSLVSSTWKMSGCLEGESSIPRPYISSLFFIPVNNFQCVYVCSYSWHVIRSFVKTGLCVGESLLLRLSSWFVSSLPATLLTEWKSPLGLFLIFVDSPSGRKNSRGILCAYVVSS